MPSAGKPSRLSLQRILFFHYNGPFCQTPDECPAGFHYWFDFAAETEFSFDGVSDVEDTSRSCAITRGAGSTRDFFGINNFVRFPSIRAARTMNEAGFLNSRIDACSGINGLQANLVIVDFWSEGNLLEIVQERNKALVTRRMLRA